MRSRRITRLRAALLALGAGLLLALPALAAGGYELPSWHVASVRGLSGGSYQLLGDAGQPWAAGAAGSGGGYQLRGGFLGELQSGAGSNRVFLPTILSQR